jgi:two-component system, cell cycle response regulator DivK
MAQESPGRAGEGKSVLVVEDDDLNYKLVDKLLGRESFRVLRAVRAEECFELARREKPAVILMDVRLTGGLNGIEATHRLKADAELKGIPVIVLSAFASEADIAVAKEAGCDDYISKPYNIMQLLAAVKHFAGVGA